MGFTSNDHDSCGSKVILVSSRRSFDDVGVATCGEQGVDDCGRTGISERT